jgi:hypothetical protein
MNFNSKYTFIVCLYNAFFQFQQTVVAQLARHGVSDEIKFPYDQKNPRHPTITNWQMIVEDLFDILLHQLSVSSRYIDKPNDGSITYRLEAVKDCIYSDLTDYINESSIFRADMEGDIGVDAAMLAEMSLTNTCMSMIDVIYTELTHQIRQTLHGRINSDPISATTYCEPNMELARIVNSTDVVVTLEFEE